MKGSRIALTSRSDLLFVIFIYLSIFINSYIFFKEPFEFYFGYTVFLVLLPVFFFRHPVNKPLLGTFLILLVIGLLNVFVNNSTYELFFKVYTGLMLSYFFYYYVIVEYSYNIELLFYWYLKGCYLAALIALGQFISFLVGFQYGYDFGYILNKWSFSPGGIFGLRLNGIFAEPTHLASVLSPAFFIAVYNMLRKETTYLNRFQSWIIIIVYVLSFSGLGQTGIFITFVLLAVSFGLFRYFIVFVPLLIALFSILYFNVKDFQERYDSLIALFSGEEFKLGETHGSSFILYNNYHVTSENFKNNYLFGSGIGSHPVAFEKYSLAKGIKTYGFNLNGADANSMFLRLISETGIFGTGIFIFLVFKCYVRRNEENETDHWLISNSILVMILLNLFRQGHYFLNGFPFFVLLYIYNWLDYTGQDAQNEP